MFQIWLHISIRDLYLPFGPAGHQTQLQSLLLHALSERIGVVDDHTVSMVADRAEILQFLCPGFSHFVHLNLVLEPF